MRGITEGLVKSLVKYNIVEGALSGHNLCTICTDQGKEGLKGKRNFYVKE